MAPLLVVPKNLNRSFFSSDCVPIDPFDVISISIELDVVINLTQTKVN
jgi:hypothetical protein